MSQPSLLPYGRQEIDDDDARAVVEALRSDWLTTGPAVERFERALSAVAGGSPIVAVNSGTAALHTAYAAIGLGPGDEVITTPLTFAATATAALHLGATVRFADVDDDTLNISPSSVSRLVTDRTRAIVAVDFAGQPADLDDLADIASAQDLVLIEDAAHAIGGRYRGRPVGDVADLTTFSFHPVKTITTAEGGAVVVRDKRFLQGVRRFRSHGLVREPELQRRPEEGPWHQEVHDLGLNYRLSDVLAALGASQLSKLDRFVARRAELVARYRAALVDVPGVRLPGVRPDVDPAWHLFPVRILDGRRRVVFDRLRAAGFGVQVHYLPVYLHPVFEDRDYRPGLCPVAEEAYDQLISLPLFPGLSDNDQARVIEKLIEVLD